MYRGGKFLRWGKHPRRINSQKRGCFFIEKPQQSSVERRDARGGKIGAAAKRLLHSRCLRFARHEKGNLGRGVQQRQRERDRSEEHTSELQSPYVISYAVF